MAMIMLIAASREVISRQKLYDRCFSDIIFFFKLPLLDRWISNHYSIVFNGLDISYIVFKIIN